MFIVTDMNVQFQGHNRVLRFEFTPAVRVLHFPDWYYIPCTEYGHSPYCWQLTDAVYVKKWLKTADIHYPDIRRIIRLIKALATRADIPLNPILVSTLAMNLAQKRAWPFVTEREMDRVRLYRVLWFLHRLEKVIRKRLPLRDLNGNNVNNLRDMNRCVVLDKICLWQREIRLRPLPESIVLLFHPQ
tara:strand:- start:1505 stop:2065 length:561 start_codon:yes stop_codon:yes gene_type:complete